MIDVSTRIVALICGIALLVFIIELVRRRKLKEEYSVLWVITAVAMLILSVWFESLEWITDRIGGVAPSSTLFFLGLLFVFFMLLHFSLRVSALERRLMSLVQEIGLLTLRPPDPDADPPAPPAPRTEPRTAVVIPCFNDGDMAAEAVGSIREEEPVDVVVVDDGSTDPGTIERLAALERDGVRVLRRENSGPAAARTAGMAATTTPFVFVLDADDLVEPGALTAMADVLEANPDAGFVWGDYVLFGDHSGSYRAPDRWLPWTLTYVNPYPVCSMFRREVLERADGWHGRANAAYEDWDLWLRLVGLEIEGRSAGRVVYRRRLHGDGRHLNALRARHRELYAELKQRNASVFGRREELRRRERPSAWKRAVYPVLFGSRRVVPMRVEAALQRTMMSMGTGLPR